MILYTMMPRELIFPNEPEAKNNQITVTCQGVPLLVERTDDNQVQVIRVLSSDPQHFLNERFLPGTKISFAAIEGLAAF